MQCRYVAEFATVYPERGLVATPGDVAEWDQLPGDGRWEPVPTTTEPVTSPASTEE